MIKLRQATMDDALDLLQWKNDPVTRKYALVTEDIIFWSNHLAWLENRIVRPGFYIIMDDDVKCGDLRFDIGASVIEVSIRIAPNMRGKGVGAKALALGVKLYIKPLIAKVVDANIASYTLFTKAGFTPIGNGTHNGKKYTILMRG